MKKYYIHRNEEAEEEIKYQYNVSALAA